MSYDAKCYDLAGVFLSDEPELNKAENREYLAQIIQDAIEETMDSLRGGAQSHEQQRQIAEASRRYF